MLKAHSIFARVQNIFSPQNVLTFLDQYVLYEDRWVGQIDDVVQTVTLRLTNNTLVQVERPENLDLATSEGAAITDHDHYFSDKFIVGQHIVTHKNNVRRGRWILGEYDPNIEPRGVIVDVRTKLLLVNWVAQRHQGALNSTVNLQVQPDSNLYPDQDPVIVLSNLSDPTSYQIGDRVRFLERDIETGRYGALRMDRRDLGGFDGNVWMVVGTKTIIDVDWQDGTTSKNVQAKDLRMYLNVDEYEGWPVRHTMTYSNYRVNMFVKRGPPVVHDLALFNP
jgi:ubiquitin-conjugating enzyme E2 O